MAKLRPQWDLGRFLETTLYFEILPFTPLLRTVQQWIQGDVAETNVSTVTDRIQPMIHKILVCGNYTVLMVALIQQLQSEGYTVQALVPDLEHDQARLGSMVQLVTLDELSHEMPGFRTLVVCLNDTSAPTSFIQDAFQITERQWSTQPEQILFDFRAATPELKQIWGALDDVVMGGVSASQLQVINQTAFFAGTVSTANSGGFASIRTRNFETPFDLSAATGIELRVRGDGKRYKFFIRTDTRWDSVAYSSSFDTEINTWLTIRLPFADMIPVFRARTLAEADPLDPSQIRSMQLMLSKFEADRELNPHFTPGPFALQLEWIGAYTAAPTPQVMVISSSPQPDLKSNLKARPLASTWIQIPQVAESGLPVRRVEGSDPEKSYQSGIATIEPVVSLCVQAIQSATPTDFSMVVDPSH